MLTFEMGGSMFLIGAALLLAGLVGVLQPTGHRSGALLAILGGAGVGIAGLGIGMPSLSNGSEEQFWGVFFASSIAGFATVVGILALTWRRARANDPTPD
jgi:hypothetical protein